MRTKNPQHSRPLRLGVLIGLLALLFPFQPPQPGGEAPFALVRIEVESEADLQALASQGLLVYDRLYTASGSVILLAAIDQRQLQNLSTDGYTSQVLDADVQGDSYFLLYGDDEALRQAGSLVDVLLVEGSQAVARLAPGEAEALESMGLQAQALFPHRLETPRLESAPSLPTITAPDPFVQEMLAQVDTGALSTYVGNLSGEWPVVINGSPFTLASRHSYNTQSINKATRHAYEFFQSIGLPVDYDYYYLYSLERRNVIAQQTGLLQPERIFLLTAHLDSYAGSSNTTNVPGADDNASGSAGLMHIAQILSQYDFACTLRYALFTGEEQGLHGSREYATDVYNQGDDIEAVLNLDMIAYNTPGTARTFWMHTRPGNAGDLAIANLFSSAVTTYNINLTPQIQQDGKTFSDHSSFWNRGYPAILAIEAWNDHTPYYHSTSDQLESFDMGYYTDFARAALATFAHMGCLMEGQLSGTVRDSSNNAPLPGAAVEAWANGELVRSAITQPDGSYGLTLYPGNYTLETVLPDYLIATAPNVPVLYNQTTQRDFSLQPCEWIDSLRITPSAFRPDVSQTVTYTAALVGGEPPISLSWDFGDGANASGQTVTHAFAAPGTYIVKLDASTACGAGASASSAAFVDVDLITFPLVPVERH